MVSAITVHVAQIQEEQTEAPTLIRFGQSKQPISDFGVHFLKPSVFGFELLQTFDHGHVHAAIFCSQLIDRGRADVVFVSKIGDGHPGCVLLQNRHGLFVGES